MSRAQDANVDRRFLLAADGPHRLFLNRPQQLDLHRQRKVSDFVEKQRAAACRLEQSFLVGDRAGETAFLVAEEFALHQFGWDRAAVHRYERCVGARALFVNQPRRQFLAAAGFATDVDRRLTARELLDLISQPLHRVRPPGEANARLDRRVQAGELQCGVDERAQLIEVHRLLNEVECARFQRRDRSVHVAVRGNDGDGQPRMVGVDPAYQFDAVAVGQVHVGQTQVEFVRREQLGGGAHVLGGLRLDVHPAERDLEQFPDVRLVVNNQCALAHRCPQALRRDPIRVSEGDPETAAPALVASVRNPGLIRFAHFAGDVEAESRAGALRREERFEQVVDPVFGYARTTSTTFRYGRSVDGSMPPSIDSVAWPVFSLL